MKMNVDIHTRVRKSLCLFTLLRWGRVKCSQLLFFGLFFALFGPVSSGISQAESLAEPQKLATLVSTALGVEHSLVHFFLYAVIALPLLLVFSIWWLLRLRKRAQRLEAVVTEANLSRRELLRKNDLLTIEFCRRDRLERELRANEERYRSYIEQAPIGIFVLRGNDEFALLNSALSQMTGYSKTELSTMKLAELFSSDTSKESATIFENIHQQDSSEKEITLRKKDGSVFISYIHAITLPGDSVMGFCMDITERKRAEEKIHHLAFFDALTALPNRRRLLDRLRQATSNGVQEHNLGALLMMDLDHFKNLNDTLGHDVGDRLLKQVGRRLMDCVRPDDTVSRVGGDEFVIILERLGKNVAVATRRADELVKKIQSAVSQLYPLTAGRPDYYITSSIGLTLFGDQDSSIDALLKKADVALYEAKKRGRNTYRFFSPEMQASIDDSTSLVDALRRALHNNEFTLYYQPQVNAVGRVVGAEALLRWTPPNADIISPLTFIAAAEESGLIVPIGDWVIVQGFKQLKRWQQYVETKDLKLSINVSADQFHQADFVAKIFNGIEQFDIDPTLITLELTESVVLQRVDQAIEKMLELKSRGISFSLDDFGTGYSSLSYLKLLPLDQVKIDSSFVRDISFDPDDAAIVRAILAMSDSLGLSVIAEGVETQVQREFLFDHGCLHYQGYLFGRPVPIENFSAHASHASK
jgi:diguanylate cyclase (GGDEF)-like protein/PAS domain S-box-containing protein